MHFAQITQWIVTQAETAADAAGAAAGAAATAAAAGAPAAVTPGGSAMEKALMGVAMQSHTTILYLLIFLSVLSLAIAIEKYIQYRRENPLGEGFKAELVKLLDKGDVKGALRLVDGVRGIKAAVVREGLLNFHEGPFVMAELMDGRTVIERDRLDKRLIILGTIGNNAPFIGLLGTVMGIIKAFHDLAMATMQGPQTVMAGISEALIATAVGLAVAIPAVVAFNYFKARGKGLVDDAISAHNIVMAFAKRVPQDDQSGAHKMDKMYSQAQA